MLNDEVCLPACPSHSEAGRMWQATRLQQRASNPCMPNMDAAPYQSVYVVRGGALRDEYATLGDASGVSQTDHVRERIGSKSSVWRPHQLQGTCVLTSAVNSDRTYARSSIQ